MALLGCSNRSGIVLPVSLPQRMSFNKTAGPIELAKKLEVANVDVKKGRQCDPPDVAAELRQQVERLYQFEMPADFYHFWVFCKKLNPQKPCGIVVPVDENGVGYRELSESDASLKKICRVIAEAPNDDERIKAFAPIQEMITYVQFANDECDYGMGFELGIDLFCFGSYYFHKVIGQLLPLAYNLLKRNLFAEIIEAHLANRNLENLDQLSV
ncbi:HPF1 factor, partial [Polypterus senegalus]